MTAPTSDCRVCGEPDAPARFLAHGHCLLAEAYGGIGNVLVPEDFGDDGEGDAGLTPRQSGRALELLIETVCPDDFVKCEDDRSLEDRRYALKVYSALARNDDDELERVAPRYAAKLRTERAFHEFADAIIGYMTTDSPDDHSEPEYVHVEDGPPTPEPETVMSDLAESPTGSPAPDAESGHPTVQPGAG